MYFYLSKILAPIINGTNLIVICIILSSLLYFFFKKKIIKYFLNIILIFFFIIVLAPIGSFGIHYLEKNFYESKLPKNFDYIVVLAGSESIEHTFKRKKLTLNNSSERLISSVKLALDYPNTQIIYIGGDGRLNKTNINFNETTVAKKFYNNIGFNLERIKFISGSRNTIENLKNLKSLKIDNQKKNLILITSAFHMKRVLLIAKKFDLKLYDYAVDYRTENIKISFLNYFQSFSISSNLSNYDIFFRELLGTLAVKIFL